MTPSDQDKERELDRSVLLGISYMGSRPAKLRDAADNLKRLGHWLISLFRGADYHPAKNKKPSTPARPGGS